MTKEIYVVKMSCENDFDTTNETLAVFEDKNTARNLCKVLNHFVENQALGFIMRNVEFYGHPQLCMMSRKLKRRLATLVYRVCPSQELVGNVIYEGGIILKPRETFYLDTTKVF